MATSETCAESAVNPPDKDKIDSHLIQYMRIALAVAIIRTKPAGQSAQLHAEQLCVRFRESQLKWKTEAERLREEVLLLRQQLLEKKWADLGLLRKDDNKVAEDVGGDEVFPTPPCSSEDPTDMLNVPSAQQEALKQHTSFLQSVLTLSTISTHNSLDSDGKNAETVTVDPVFEQTAQESIESALITLGDLLTNPMLTSPVISLKMMHHMVQVMANLVNNRCFSRHFSDVVCDKVLCFVWGIITALLANTGLGEGACDRLSHLIVLLSRSPSLQPSIVQMLVTQLIQVSRHLQAVHLHHTAINLTLFQNSYHLLRSLEQIIEGAILRLDKSLTFVFCDNLTKQLDGCLLHIWESFQPFSQYIWHIQGLLQYLHPSLSDNTELGMNV